MEVEPDQLRGRRPVVSRSPVVARRHRVGRVSHDVVLNRGIVGHAIVHPSCPVVEEPERAGQRVRPLTVRVRDLFRGERPVSPGPHYQATPAAGSRAAPVVDRHERVDRSLTEDVVPAAPEDGRRIDAMRLRLRVHLFPELVVPVVMEESLQIRGIGLDLLQPALCKRLPGGSALVGGLRIEVGESDRHVLSLEHLRRARGHHVLGDAQCGSSPGADASVGPRLPRNPLQGVMPIPSLRPSVIVEDEGVAPR